MLSDNIKALRKQKGYTQEELAAVLLGFNYTISSESAEMVVEESVIEMEAELEEE